MSKKLRKHKRQRNTGFQYWKSEEQRQHEKQDEYITTEETSFNAMIPFNSMIMNKLVT